MGQNQDDSSIDMLERLLHDEIRPHSATLPLPLPLPLPLSLPLSLPLPLPSQLPLPSEPNVIRTKRQAHRKTQSVSYMNPNYSRPISHSRQSSLSRVDLESPTSPSSPSFLSSNNRLIGGHRKFHSLGIPTVIQPFFNSGFSSAPNSPQSYMQQSQAQAQAQAQMLPYNQVMNQRINSPIEYQFPNMHQKTLSGSKMVDEFLVMKLESQAENSSTMRRLHPLLRDAQFSTIAPEIYQEKAGYSDPYQAFSPVARQEENDSFHSGVTEDVYLFNDESGMGGEDDLYDEAEQSSIVTKCGWGECVLECATQEFLVEHILQDHVTTGKSSYVCDWVGCSRDQKPFSKRHKIQNHIRIHTGERPFACPVADCGKKFSRQDGLNTHIKPYICPIANCGKAYFHARSLRKHEKAHQDGQYGNMTDQVGTSSFSFPQYSYGEPQAFEQGLLFRQQESTYSGQRQVFPQEHFQQDFQLGSHGLVELDSPLMVGEHQGFGWNGQM